MKTLLYAAVFLFAIPLSAQKTRKMNTVRFEIPEAGIVFEAPDGWSFVGKMGTLDQGRVEYNYTHDHVRGNGRAVNPAIIVTVDKGSWFDDEKNYLEEKIQFYEAMDDRIEKTHPPGDKHNPLKINAYYSEGISGDPENPFGERFILITFWTEKAGFHMEIHTSGNDLKAAYEAYNAMLKSIRKI